MACDRRDPVVVEHSTRAGIHSPSAQFREGGHARVVSGPTLLTGICFCSACGKAMTLRTGKGGRYRYYTCSTKARQGETGCQGPTVPIQTLPTTVCRALSRTKKRKLVMSIQEGRSLRRGRLSSPGVHRTARETGASRHHVCEAISFVCDIVYTHIPQNTNCILREPLCAV